MKYKSYRKIVPNWIPMPIEIKCSIDSSSSASSSANSIRNSAADNNSSDSNNDIYNKHSSDINSDISNLFEYQYYADIPRITYIQTDKNKENKENKNPKVNGEKTSHPIQGSFRIYKFKLNSLDSDSINKELAMSVIQEAGQSSGIGNAFSYLNFISIFFDTSLCIYMFTTLIFSSFFLYRSDIGFIIDCNYSS